MLVSFGCAIDDFTARNPNVYRMRLPHFRDSFLFVASFPILIGTLVERSKCFLTSSSFNVGLEVMRIGESNCLFSEPHGKCYKSC